jgi:hypothetical protein
MSAKTQRSTKKARKWPVWVGSMDDLRRLATVIDEVVEIRRKTVLESFDAETERQLKEADAKSMAEVTEATQAGKDTSRASKSEKAETDKKWIRNRRKEGRENLEEDYRLTVTIVDGDDKTKGGIEPVLAEVDRRTVGSIKFSTEKYGDQVAVTLERNNSHSDCGVELEVSSPDRGWGNHAYAQLSDEISKGEPRYSWIRKWYGRGTVGIGSSILIVLAVVLIILPAVSRKDRFLVWIIGFFCTYGLAVTAVMTDRFHDWLAPRFEITGQDGQSSGGRRIGAIIGLVSAVLIGIVVNRIYP